MHPRGYGPVIAKTQSYFTSVFTPKVVDISLPWTMQTLIPAWNSRRISRLATADHDWRCHMQWRSQPRNCVGGEMFDFRLMTLFCLEKHLPKHKMTIFSKNFWEAWSLGPPLLRLCSHTFVRSMMTTKSSQLGFLHFSWRNFAWNENLFLTNR